jgi:hypothetical protein
MVTEAQERLIEAVLSRYREVLRDEPCFGGMEGQARQVVMRSPGHDGEQ